MLPFPDNHWLPLLAPEFEKGYYRVLMDFIQKEYEMKTVYPPEEDVFNALKYTDYPDVKAVILGQDPYHGPGQAHGLSFSVRPEVKIPPSLRNIFKELKEDTDAAVPNNGYLRKWADEGVLMLNSILTVRAGEAFSHRGKGWETFTDRIISLVNAREEPAVFILWGRPAQEKIRLIDTKKHRIIQSPHPSPFAARKGFFGSRPFSRTNEFLKDAGEAPIDWQIENIPRP